MKYAKNENKIKKKNTVILTKSKYFPDEEA